MRAESREAQTDRDQFVFVCAVPGVGLALGAFETSLEQVERCLLLGVMGWLVHTLRLHAAQL